MEYSMQNGQEDCPLRGGECHQLAPNFPWAISSRQDNDGISGDGDDMEISIEELREIRRKQGAAIEELSSYSYGGGV
ncbi:hypothetical protein FD754_008252 [Muntiacus muntjak]|uniref:Uncharacterized protein n=1 Tax=Muntiacus muntjak TaxID=9888 RepID=A0A5N3WV50_MUNMU|nr:hypothetical protein FD754_008252 [Muntiacus muntjak]